MICDICKQDLLEVQTFTLRDEEETLKLCKKDYEFLVKNNRVTGKLVATRCKACHQPTGYEWIKYKAPGKKRKGAAGNEVLDSFFDMRSPMERLTQKKARKKKEGVDAPQHIDKLPAEEGQGVQPAGPTDAAPEQ